VAVRQPGKVENLLLKPYFWLRPSQILRRLVCALPASPGPRLVRLPWGLVVECNSTEMLGRALVRTGVFELATTEALVRLVDPGELALDVGANIGYMTSLLARASGAGGRVIAYEPNPDVYQQLVRNVRRWPDAALAKVEVREAALSDRSGTAPLTIPEGNSEWSAIGDQPTARAPTSEHVTVPVQTVTLDGELQSEAVGVLKLDVEDHEAAALRGALTLLKNKRIRDILFEDHDSYPSETTKALEAHGYVIFDIVPRALGVAMVAPNSAAPYASWDAPMRLATLDPVRAHSRLGRRGWMSLTDPTRWRKSAPRQSCSDLHARL
jgi:FkbM family methyltransferase